MGDLDQVPEYGQKLKELAQNRPVIFMPAVEEQSLLFGMLDLCKLFVFPSTGEGMSIMLLEAAALGIPMICSDIPENRSVLGDQALYFRSGDAADLADKIRWAIEHPQEAARFGQATREWIRREFSWDLVASQYEMLYLHYTREKQEAVSL
jgi:glycosyltransferase involved in cell wall biosynthesis